MVEDSSSLPIDVVADVKTEKVNTLAMVTFVCSFYTCLLFNRLLSWGATGLLVLLFAKLQC